MVSFSSTANATGSAIGYYVQTSNIAEQMANAVVQGIDDAVTGTTTSGNGTAIMYNEEQDRVGLMMEDSFSGLYDNNLETLFTPDKPTNPTLNWFENSLVADPQIYDLMNTYRYVYSKGVLIPMSGYRYDNNGDVDGYLYASMSGGSVTPSLFNPYYGIQKIGMTRNTPLMDDVMSDQMIETDFTDCSIMKLVSLSKNKLSSLGQARYKYSDFMYCKDLGMPNNRMITLRRFAMPVGDNIFGAESAARSLGKDGAESTFSTPGDVGRLIGYFDTEENKLEDILNYNYDVTWENREADVEWQNSKADDNANKSKLAQLVNLFSPQYTQAVLDGIEGVTLPWFGNQSLKIGSKDWYNANQEIFNKDKWKVYAPLNTVREMYTPTGKIEFRQEIQLTFVYTLRSYDNINPKSAMLDLIGNILATTATSGRFWGGSPEIIGPQPNLAGWKKANAIIDNAWDTLGAMFKSIGNGGGDASAQMGSIADQMKNAVDAAGTSFNKMLTSAADAASDLWGRILKASTSFTDIGKALTKNILGRSETYMFNSMLTGDNTGLWHLTIGNPRNPIAVMGNMIMTDAKIQHFGPLGLDDFPTGVKVTVTLKHARPRDFVNIQKMYTRGTMAMYINMNNPEDEGTTPVHYNEGITGPIYLGDWDMERTERNRNEIR